MDKPVEEQRYRAPALDKGLDILELLSAQPNGLTRAEIVKEMGRGPSEIYRMLERLVARDYVSRSAGGDRYALTMKLFVLGSRHPPLRRLVAQAQPLMDVFARETQQSCHLVVPEHGVGVVVGQASGPANWEFRLRIGARLDLATTGSGLTLLAFQSAESRAEILAGGGPEGPKDLSTIEPQLQEIRRRGYRIADSRQLAGIRDVSVPIQGPTEDCVAAITCPYLRRLEGAPGADIDGVLQALLALAAGLSLA